jgi:hypothetical protein
LEPTDVKRLRQIEQENGRLKKLVADLTLDLGFSISTMSPNTVSWGPAPIANNDEWPLARFMP